MKSPHVLHMHLLILAILTTLPGHENKNFVWVTAAFPEPKKVPGRGDPHYTVAGIVVNRNTSKLEREKWKHPSPLHRQKRTLNYVGVSLPVSV